MVIKIDNSVIGIKMIIDMKTLKQNFQRKNLARKENGTLNSSLMNTRFNKSWHQIFTINQQFLRSTAQVTI